MSRPPTDAEKAEEIKQGVIWRAERAETERDELRAKTAGLTRTYVRTMQELGQALGDLRLTSDALDAREAELAAARAALVEAQAENERLTALVNLQRDFGCNAADRDEARRALVEAETRVEALRAVSEAATPGTWTAYFGAHGDPRVVADITRPLTTGIANVSSAPDDYGKADAEFIAAACNYVRAALAAVPTQPAPTTILRTDDKYAYGKHANGEGWRIRREGAVPEATAPTCEHGKTEPHDATASDKNFHPVSFWCPGPAPEGEQQ